MFACVRVCVLLDILAEYRKSCSAEDLEKLKIAVCIGQCVNCLLLSVCNTHINTHYRFAISLSSILCGTSFHEHCHLRRLSPSSTDLGTLRVELKVGKLQVDLHCAKPYVIW